MNQLKEHWEKIYSTKQAHEVSWTQTYPTTSLAFLHAARLDKKARIIDVGGGDSRLVDYLLAEGYENISVLDISETALNKARMRLGDKASLVHWIVSDVLEFQPGTIYDLWHDRATFHFLTTENQIVGYLSVARRAVKEDGMVTIGTFSQEGPETCSGLPIRRYSEEALTQELQNGFEKIKCVTEDHVTPFQTKQNFLFCSFRRHSN